MKYEIVVDGYEGPLDLLLDLIKNAKVDIYDIPINIITEQYMDYIYSMENLNLDIASEFILMAASLLEIKSKMLLPKKEKEEEEEDPRDDLVRKLLEYKRYKDAANKLKKREEVEIKSYYKPKEDLSDFQENIEFKKMDLEVLVKTINNIMRNQAILDEDIEIQEIRKDEYNIKECSANIVELLKSKESISFVELLGKDPSKNKIVTYFLASLELIKLNIIVIEQVRDFSDLIIRKKGD